MKHPSAAFNNKKPRLAKQEEEDFLKAACTGNCIYMQEFLEKYPETGADKEKLLRAGLHRAAQNGRNASIALLLGAGISIEAGNHDGWTALMIAAKSGQEDSVKFLLEKGAAVDRKSKVGKTALMYAAGSGRAEAMGTLLAWGACVDGRSNNGMTALMYASRTREGEPLSAAEFLVAHGADIFAADNFGMTAKKHAEKAKKIEMATLLDRKVQEEIADFSPKLKRSMRAAAPIKFQKRLAP